jgi:hypothetical protein
VSDGQVAVQRRQAALVEDLRDQPHVLDDRDGLAVGDGDPGRFLPAVLEGEQPEVGEVGDRLTRRVNTEHPAGFTDAVVHCLGD